MKRNMSTRSSTSTTTTSKPSTPTPTPTSTSTQDRVTHQASTTNPPLFFILPHSSSKPDSRILNLPNPATSTPTRYLFCPSTTTLFEFTKIAAPKNSPRSWLIAPDNSSTTTSAHDGECSKLSKGYTTEHADLFVATPIDALFIVLPALLCTSASTSTSQHQLFLTIDDHLDNLSESQPSSSTHLLHILQTHPSLVQRLEKRAKAICDSITMGNETLYRLSHEKLLLQLVRKARKMVDGITLPSSLETHFIHHLLRVPIMSVQREDSTQTSMTHLDTASTADSASTCTSKDMIELLRLRTALDLILSTYIPETLHKPLNDLLASSAPPSPPLSTNSSLPNFQPLTLHLLHLSTQKQKQQSLYSLSDNISRKRNGAGINDEEAEEREATKKRKRDEEEAKKKNSSRGVKQLAKVNTSGMAKMSSFFGKRDTTSGANK